jgi:hypothetical protein
MFEIISKRQIAHYFILYKLSFDHRVFPWGLQKLHVIDRPTKYCNPEVLDGMLRGENYRKYIKYLNRYANKYNNVPFVFDIYDPTCYMLLR